MITLLTKGLLKYPCERDLRHGHLALLRQGAHGIDAFEDALLVHRRKIKGRAPRSGRALVVGRAELAAQQSARQGTPYHQPQLLILQQRYDFPFEIAPRDGVVGLHADELRKTPLLRRAQEPS